MSVSKCKPTGVDVAIMLSVTCLYFQIVQTEHENGVLHLMLNNKMVNPFPKMSNISFNRCKWLTILNF